MRSCEQFYIDGQWVDPISSKRIEVVNPAKEAVCGVIAAGDEADVDKAVKAAHKAFASYGFSSKEERIALLEKVLESYQKHYADIAHAVTEEMGAPAKLSMEGQTWSGLAHFTTVLELLKEFSFEEQHDGYKLRKEPVGVCALITPWNWPVNQIAAKVAPALAVGCTMVVKPSEVAPLSGYIFAQVMHDAGVPPGVFNMVNGDGAGVGTYLASHPDVEMVSFTGSTRAGKLVATNAASTVKRVCQELGGKSANILLDDVDLSEAVSRSVISMFSNTGQSCNAPSRMLVPKDKMPEVLEIAKNAAASVVVGDPNMEETTMGPLASEVQFNKVQGLIKKGVDEGAALVCGGLGRPDGIDKGFYVKPTIFADVDNNMTIAREEIFGPVLSIIAYKDEEDAINIANDTDYGLAGYIQGKDEQRIAKVASKIRAGNIYVNGQGPNFFAPFGGYKQSGNGREWGAYGIHDFLEIKTVIA